MVKICENVHVFMFHVNFKHESTETCTFHVNFHLVPPHYIIMVKSPLCTLISAQVHWA